MSAMARLQSWTELTSPELAARAGERCAAVLPVGAVEQHGPHLPLGTDAMIAQGIVASAAPLLAADGDVVLLPAQEIGESTEHRSFAGTLSHEAETLLGAWTEIGACLARSGIFKLVIVNGHGGQPGIVDLVAQRLRARYRMLAVRANYMAWPLPRDLAGADPHGHHGGLVETAMMLALHPALVRMDLARDFATRAGDLAARHRRFGRDGRLGFAWQAEDHNPAGVTGRAAAADADTGRILLDHYGRILAELIDDALAFDRPAHFDGARED